MSATLDRPGVARVCGGCGSEFVDYSRTSPRTYCDDCREGRTDQPAIPASVPGVQFTVEHFRSWSSRFKLKSGKVFRLEQYQARFLEDLFARDEDDRPVFEELWLIVPEGNGKTTFLALVVLYTIEFVPEAWVPCAASARDQGVDLTYRACAGFVLRNALEAAFKLHPGYRQIVHKASLGSAKIFASDAASGDGVDPTLALIEELHRLSTMELYETWAGKLDKSGGQLVVVSTAGAPGSAFEELREKIRAQAESVDREECFARSVGAGVVMHEWALPEKADPEDLELVARANPLSTKTVASLAKKRAKPSWRLSHWLRFTCNRPTVTDSDLFIDLDAWAALGDADPLEVGTAVCIGADGSRTWDTTVIAWASALDETITVDCRVFSVRESAPHHVLHRGGKIDFADVEEFIVSLFDEYEPVETAYDPRYLERSMEIVDVRLPEACVIAVEPSSKHARDAYQALYRAVAEGTLRHSGDPVLAAHLANCAVERDDRNQEIKRLRKIDPRKPIDAVPALAFAVWRATLAERQSAALVSFG